MKGSYDGTNQVLLNMLGMGELRNVTRVTVDLQVGRLPLATVTQALLRDKWEKTTQQFKLVTLDEDPVPLDIDAMADAARKRVHDFIDLQAFKASMHVTDGFNMERVRFSMACDTTTFISDLKAAIGTCEGGSFLGAIGASAFGTIPLPLKGIL